MQNFIRQLIALFAGFMLQHGVTMDAHSSASIIVALLAFGGACFWSWLVKLEWSRSRNLSALINENRADAIRKALGSLVSQGLSLLAGYWQAKTGEAVNTADPAALLLFIANLGASKVGLHQKLAAVGAKSSALVAAALLSLAVLPSCAPLMNAALSNRALIEGAIQYGVKTGIDAGYKALEKKAAEDAAAKTSAKNPVPDVNPPAAKNPVPDVEPSLSCKTPASDAPGAEGAPAYLRIVAVPDYGARVAASLKTLPN